VAARRVPKEVRRIIIVLTATKEVSANTALRRRAWSFVLSLMKQKNAESMHTVEF
tara:strand:+ start:1202 stop:1366 length:165 start_codon:yes stop_codon:yes gene_type:complete